MNRLNCGCGNTPMEGYINVDKYYYPGSPWPLTTRPKTEEWKNGLHQGEWKYGDAIDLKDFQENEFDEVMLVHCLEHMSMEEGNRAIQSAVRVCKQGGSVEIEVPDLLESCRLMLETPYNPDPKGDNSKWFRCMGLLHGTTGMDGEGQFHLCGYAKDYLKAKMEEHHLKDVKEIPERLGFGHGPKETFNFRMIGYK